MAKKSKNKTFKTVEEFQNFYATEKTKKKTQGSKYYHIGENIAKMACEKATSQMQAGQAI